MHSRFLGPEIRRKDRWRISQSRLTEYSEYRFLGADEGVKVRLTECRRRDATLGFEEDEASGLEDMALEMFFATDDGGRMLRGGDEEQEDVDVGRTTYNWQLQQPTLFWGRRRVRSASDTRQTGHNSVAVSADNKQF